MKHVRTRLDKLFDGLPSDNDTHTEKETLINLFLRHQTFKTCSYWIYTNIFLE